MNPKNKNQYDEDLIDAARKIIQLRFKENVHEVAAAIRTKSGRVFAAVHLEAYIGRIAVCAEAIALGMAAEQGDTEIDTVVAVNKIGNIVAPCGMCRELISDYSPDANIIIPVGSGYDVVKVSTLLPCKYTRT